MILLIGPSAVGKTEIAKELFKLYNLKKVVTHTTRAMRINEINNIDYHFVSKEEFLELKNQDYFVETTFYNNNYYGTSKKEIQDDKVLIVDPNGKDAFLALNDKRIVIFYLIANDDLRKKRMIERGDSLKTIEERLSKDKVYFDENSKKGVNFIIYNENISLENIARDIYQKYISFK